jgi:hypothetical protein
MATPSMGPAMTLGQTMFQKGKGLLSEPVVGNGYGQNFGKVAPNGFGQVQLNPTDVNNPYVKGMRQDIRNSATDLLGDALMGIQGNAVASGGLGGSRQGLAQGTAIAKGMDYVSGNIANFMGGLYENQANRNLQQYGMDQGFYGQQRGQDIGLQGQNQQFFQGQRGQDLAQYGIGSGLIQNGLNTQWLPIQNATNAYAPFSGMGTTTNSAQQGGGWQGALGGGLGVLGLGSQLGWWGSK